MGRGPGIAERLAVWCLRGGGILEASWVVGVSRSEPGNSDLSAAVPGRTGQAMLCLLGGVLLLMGMLIFSLREYSR